VKKKDFAQFHPITREQYVNQPKLTELDADHEEKITQKKERNFTTPRKKILSKRVKEKKIII